MRAAGCDFFPENDAWSYLKGLAVKHPVASKHLHACMGLLCTAYAFSWSRWNAARGTREIAMQIKEVHGCIAKEVSFKFTISFDNRNNFRDNFSMHSGFFQKLFQ